MSSRHTHRGRVIPFRKRRRSRRSLSARLGVVFVFGAAMTFGLYLRHDGHTQSGWDFATDAFSAGTSESKQPRALRGGNAMRGSGGKAVSRRSPAGDPSYGRVTHVRDGDTIEVNGRPIRIAALDCAESGTIAGNAATRRMKALVSGEQVKCSLTGRRSYDRWIGSCQLESGQDVADVMIGEGLCGRWR